MNIYDQVAKTSGVDRKSVKRVLTAFGYSGGAVSEIEEAFRSGFKSARSYADFLEEHGNEADWEWAETTGWSNSTLSGKAKELDK